jgi:Type II intron maturase
VPANVIKAKSAPYMARGKPACQNSLVNETDHVIVGKFAIEYRGVVQYYLMAGDVFRLHRLRWVMETSMLRTLARKHGSTVSKMAARFKATGQREGTGGPIWRDSPQAAEDGGTDRPSGRSRLSS